MSQIKQLTHIGKSGEIQMVDVGKKKVVRRRAVARGLIILQPYTLQLIREEKIAKGNVLTTAKLAGIMAAKRTAEIIPLCHPLNIDFVDVCFASTDEGIVIEAEVVIEAKTGVEMEALSAVAAAALTIYDMCKAVDKKMVIGEIRLVKKSKR